MGFREVIEYVSGKQAWFDENQPREGRSADEIWVGDLADGAVPTCGPRETIGAVRERVGVADPQTCVVVNDERVVVGLLRKAELQGDPSRTAGEVMRLGPKTFRPSVTLSELLTSMREHDITTNSLVTTLDGRLVGTISRADAEATMAHEAG